jgi:hypothetical protein
MSTATSPVQSIGPGYYLGRLTSEYNQAEIFKSWMLSVLNIASDISNCLQFISSSFDLDYASGVQLDTLGVIVGASRTVPFQPSNSVSPILDDTTYRLLIKATIANNQWNGTIGELYPIWQTLFPGGSIIIIDNQNMTADITVTGNFSSIIKDLISNGMIVPRPQAVEYTYIFGQLPFFGFDRNDAFIAGWDIGHWG